MRIGMVCPYSFDVPGGVQAHVVDLAQVLIERGHKVSVLAPASEDTVLPPFVVSAGRAVAIPYNGSVARLSFGPVSYARVRRWINDNDFDVLHIHEPNAPSLSMLALKVAEGPIVATFHTSTTKSLVLSTFQSVLQPFLEKISGRIAVSELARRWQVTSLGGDAVEIPNGVDVPFFAHAPLLPGYPRAGRTVLFLGRYDEPRKGMAVLLGALPTLVGKYPDLEVLVVGRGDEDKLRKEAGPLAKHLRLLGQVSDAEKASAMRSADVYCAPNLGGESFGIVLVEAMAAGTAVVASELDAFRRVLRDGRAGVLVPVGDSDALAEGILEVLGNDPRRAELVAEGSAVVGTYDWPVVAEQILRVYETVTVGAGRVREVRS
ncbi:glycosyltransferase family 4 protein [Rhodococcus sp. O3]|uniref:glycosyltransferase family 4 protein n=1 Tax=Rhodococcus sp. O3 TaxID=3404919 RepID=UPI003B67E590